MGVFSFALLQELTIYRFFGAPGNWESGIWALSLCLAFLNGMILFLFITGIIDYYVALTLERDKKGIEYTFELKKKEGEK